MRCAVVLGALLLAGCSVRLETERAVAEPLAEAETRRLVEAEGAPSAAGTWYRVSAVLPRSSVRRIVRWELYTHLVVERCDSGERLTAVTPARIGGANGDFRAIRNLLEAQPDRSSFVLGGPAFFPVATPRNGLCVRIEGGSYTLQKIASVPAPLHFRRIAQGAG